MNRLRALQNATRRLRRDVAELHFADPVACVYNPLDYAARPYAAYLRQYACQPKHVIFLGMNPGPFGMAQTGIPFGEVSSVRDWLGIEARVEKPDAEHPRRPVEGFACVRSEVSGRRLWGAVARAFGRPEQFFARHWVANYCPLAFLEAGGRNRTPDKLPPAERQPLYHACDRHLRSLVRILEPTWVVGIGAFAERRARDALAGTPVEIGAILHPSPANPRANRDWEGTARSQLRTLGLCAGSS